MITGINHITLSVKDIKQSFIFYKDVLKLKPVMISSYSAYFTAGKTWIALVEEKDKDQKTVLYSHIAFDLNRKKYVKLKTRLIELKIESWQENKTEGESFYFLDPSGNKLEIHFSNLKKRIKYGKKNWGKEIEWLV